MSIVTLLTDFGTRDEYVGAMKGVILSINPSATIVDITHHLDPQDITGAAYLVQSCYRYFPPGAIHLAVVDPGVGSDRKMLALASGGHVFLAPDNGLLSLVLKKGPVDALRYIDDARLFLPSVSRTFHGRDIFAPVAAHLSLGLGIEETGKPAHLSSLVLLDLPVPRKSDKGELVCEIVTVDRFGNLVTNLDEETLQRFRGDREAGKIQVRISHRTITGLADTYSAVRGGDPLATIGSRGYLEIAVSAGDARDFFMADRGDRVYVTVAA